MNVVWRNRYSKNGDYYGARIQVMMGKKTFEGSVNRDVNNNMNLSFHLLGITSCKLDSTLPDDIQNEATEIILKRANDRINEISSLVEAFNENLKVETFHCKV